MKKTSILWFLIIIIPRDDISLNTRSSFPKILNLGKLSLTYHAKYENLYQGYVMKFIYWVSLQEINLNSNFHKYPSIPTERINSYQMLESGNSESNNIWECIPSTSFPDNNKITRHTHKNKSKTRFIHIVWDFEIDKVSHLVYNI